MGSALKLSLMNDGISHKIKHKHAYDDERGTTDCASHAPD